MENNETKFPLLKLTVVVVIELAIGLSINFTRGEYPFESIGGLFPFIALLTVVLFAFFHGRKISSTRLQLLSGALFLVLFSSILWLRLMDF